MRNRIGVFGPKLLGVLLVLAFCQTVGAKEKLNGDWEGALDNGKLPMIFHIRLEGGTTVDSPKQGINGLQAFTSLSGKTVRITMPGAAAAFEGTLDGSTISGTFSQAGAKYPLKLSKSSKKSGT